MIFRQLFEPVSCTYRYLLACPDTGACAIIDPVIDTVERDLQVLRSLGLTLTCTIDTHIHADHLTSALKLKHLTDSRICGLAMGRLPCTNVGLREGEPPKNLNRGTSKWRATVAGAVLQHRES